MAESKEKNIYLLFAPKSDRGLRVDYPELSRYDELKGLGRRELLFVWYYACKSSPYFNMDVKDPRLVVEKCLEASGLIFQDETKKAKFLARDFPEKISAAIKVMSSFEPSVRILAKLKAVKAIATLERLTNLKLDEDGNHSSFKNKDGQVSFTSRKQYQDAVIAAQEKMDALIEKAEQGYGITIIDSSANKNIDDNGLSFAESYHENID